MFIGTVLYRTRRDTARQQYTLVT